VRTAPLPLVALLLVATAARAGADEPRFGLGLQLSPASLPHGSAGIPVAGSADDHVALALTFRWRLLRWAALDAGIGLPLPTLGLSLWAGFAPSWTLWRERRGVVAVELYAAPGLQLGFAGPDWQARRSDAYAGFAYIYQGPLAFALRTPVGVNVRWWRGRFDTYAEALTILTLTPSVEALVGATVGARVSF
jgi:hypothetical protein